jgi:hypothetical protein
MTNSLIHRFGLSVPLAFVLATLAGSIITACDPPRSDMLSDSSGASASADVGGPVHSAAKVGKPKSGDVVLAGGWTTGGRSSATAEFYDPTTGKFTSTGSMATTAGALSADLLNSGEILVAGGFGGKSKFTKKTVSTKVTGAATKNLQTYDPTTGLFTSTTDALITARMGATATTLPSGKVLIAGGVDATGVPLNTAEVFDRGSGATVVTSNAMGSARAFHTATLLSGKVLLIGGATDSTGNLTASADLYDPSTNKFTATGAMGTARGAHATVVLTSGPDSGKVLVVGGVIGSSAALSATQSAELYDPGTGKFTVVGAVMNDTRAFQSATVLANGDVLIVGGFSNFSSTVNGGTGSLMSLFGSTLKSAEIYDPTAVTFTCVPGKGLGGSVCKASMKMARAAHTATIFTAGPLAGEVLVAGGIGASAPNSTSTELSEAELYNPASNSFKKIANLKTARGLHVAILLP